MPLEGATQVEQQGRPGSEKSGVREDMLRRGSGGGHALVLGSLQRTVVLPEGYLVLCPGGHC